MGVSGPVPRSPAPTYVQIPAFDALPCDILEEIYFCLPKPDLWNCLCLSKKASYEASKRPLYRTISLSDIDKAYKLLTAVLDKPKRGKWIRKLILVPINASASFYAETDADAAVLATHILHLLHHTPKLEALRLPAISRSLHGAYSAVMNDKLNLRHLALACFVPAPSTILQLDTIDTRTVFHMIQLRSLHIQSFVELFRLSELLEAVKGRPAMEHLRELSVDSVELKASSLDACLSRMPNLITLSFEDSMYIPAPDVLGILRKRCSSLSHLKLSLFNTHEVEEDDLEFWSWLKDFPSLISLRLTGRCMNKTSIASIASAQVNLISLIQGTLSPRDLIECVEHNTKLKYLRVDNHPIHNRDVWEEDWQILKDLTERREIEYLKEDWKRASHPWPELYGGYDWSTDEQ